MGIFDMFTNNIDTESDSFPKERYQEYVNNVFMWMFVGLVITAIVSIASYATGFIGNMPVLIWYGSFIVQFAIIILFVITNKLLPAGVSKFFFLIYSIVNGFTMSIIFYSYDATSIGAVFLVSAGLFGGLTLYGSKTKKDFTRFGALVVATIICCLVLLLVNLIMQIQFMIIVIEWALLFLFMIVTIIDIQKMKREFVNNESNQSALEKAEISSAFSLYLDFIVIFLKLLRLFGKRKK